MLAYAINVSQAGLEALAREFDQVIVHRPGSHGSLSLMQLMIVSGAGKLVCSKQMASVLRPDLVEIEPGRFESPP